MEAQVLDHYLRFIFYLSHIPVYLFRGKKVLYVHSPEYEDTDLSDVRLAAWERTPFHPDHLLKEGEHIGYTISQELIAIGEVRDQSSDLRVVLGPVLLGDLTESCLRRMFLEYQIPVNTLQQIAQHLRKSPRMMLDTFLWFLSALNITINQQIWNSREDMVDNMSMESLLEKAALFREENAEYVSTSPKLAYAYELQLLHYLEQGDTKGLMQWWNNAYRAERGKAQHMNGGLSLHSWNRFIATAAIVSRAAIRAGLSAETAFPLYDYYVELAHKQQNPSFWEEITTQMLQDICERVRKSRHQKTENPLVNKAAAEIEEHIDHPPSVRNLAAQLQVTPEYLSASFRKVMGVTITEYTNKKRIERAQRLLRYTDRSLADIAQYLSFSSQSHFQNMFKKITGLTPQEYRSREQI